MIYKFVLAFVGIWFTIFFCGCNDFTYQKHIVGKYYIIGVDTDLSLDYDLGSGSFVGKVPGTLKEYGYNDSVLVGKTQEFDKGYPTYYMIDRRKDFDTAIEDSFRLGPFQQKTFDSLWGRRLNLRMTKVK